MRPPKVLQYMAARASGGGQSGWHPSRDGHSRRDRFLASTPAEWAKAVVELAANPDLRRQMGGSARQVVADRYNVLRWGPRLAALLDATAHRRPVEPVGESCPGDLSAQSAPERSSK